VLEGVALLSLREAPSRAEGDSATGAERAFVPCAVIPVFDHEHAIARVVDAVLAQGLPVLLVDDGSGEACARELDRLAQLPNVTLLRRAQNGGKGAAVCTGAREAYARGFTHALQIDADGQHALSDIRQFIEQARAYPDAVVCGRPIFDSSIPAKRFYGRYLSHGMVWLETLSLEIIDSMCGFRVYPLRAVNTLLDRYTVGSHMDFDTDILVRLLWRNVPTRWIGTRVRYPLDGVSHYRMFRDNVLMVRLHFRLFFGMVIRLPLLLSRKFARRTHAETPGPAAGEVVKR
jgi:glycosyltransferase involved in cell wall biosynthesis